MPSLLSRRDELRALRLAGSQPETAGELQELLEEIRERTVEAVLADERVKERLEGVRHAVLAADYREDKSDEEGEVRRLAEIGIYDYERDVLVVVVVDLRQGSVLELVERSGVQPPVTSEELEAARRLIPSDHQAHAAANRSDTHVVAFPTPPSVEDHTRFGHRCVTLYFSPERSHLDVAQITIDLSREEVVPDEELAASTPRLGRDAEQDR